MIAMCPRITALLQHIASSQRASQSKTAMSSRLSFLGLLLALLAAPAAAQVTVTDVWVRGTVPGQKGTGAFMKLTSAADLTLVGVASPAAKVAEIHEMARDGNMMRMRAVDTLALPAGKPIDLKPGGYHVMLMDLTQPLREGETIPVTLTFADKTGRRFTQEIKAPVRALTAAMPGMKH
jgi:copper(I)-binding protein